MKKKRSTCFVLIFMQLIILVMGCGSREKQNQSDAGGQTAVNGHIDFDVLHKQNEEIFAWIYVPGTNIDVPIAQSAERDGFYEDHNWKQEEDENGCAYTEMANLINMCDFNTVVHGKSNEEGTMFSELHKFSDKDFFDKNGQIYIYQPDNVLTYQVVAIHREEKHSIIQDYDLVSSDGCESYIRDIKEKAAQTGIYREGWDELTPRHFLLTLVTECPEEEGTQEVITAVLVQDAAKKIDRVIYK